jgi:predicted MFS family arabinose efflux permease
MMADMVGLENMSSAFGYMMMFFGITIFFGNPLAGKVAFKLHFPALT